MVVTAVVGGSIISAGASIYSSNKASKAAKDANKSAAAAANDQLEFEKAKYAEETERWEETFGSVQDNLSEHYENLDADFISAQGIQDFEQERSKAMTQLNETFAQRGITGSGVQAATEMSNQLTGAERRAQIRVESDRDVIEQQQGFLQMGLNHQADSSGVSNAMQSQTNVAQNNANNAANTAAQANQDMTNAVAGVAQVGVDWAAGKFD